VTLNLVAVEKFKIFVLGTLYGSTLIYLNGF